MCHKWPIQLYVGGESKTYVTNAVQNKYVFILGLNEHTEVLL